jgi:hypothetical protein
MYYFFESRWTSEVAPRGAPARQTQGLRQVHATHERVGALRKPAENTLNRRA